MKLIIVIGFLVAVALAKPKHTRNDPHNIKEIRDKCQEDAATHVEESVFKDIKRHGKDAQLPENYDKHILCVTKGMGMIGEDGKIIEEGVKTNVGHVEQDAAKQETIVEECNVDKATAEETALKLWECLSKNHVWSTPHSRHHSGERKGSKNEEHQH